MPILLKSFESTGDSDSPIGDLGADEYNLATSFSLDATYTVDRVDLYLKKVNSIPDNITVRIETDAAGPKPSGSLVDANATKVIVVSSTSYSWVQVQFPAGFTLTSGVKYWIKCTVPGSQATNDHYDWLRNALGGLYAGYGQSVQVNGGAWGNQDNAANCYFRVYKQDVSSPSLSPSASASPSSSISLSPSSSASPSSSISRSPSISVSLSPSLSPSSSLSRSPSLSPSSSVSSSVSPSASPSPTPVENTLSVDLVCVHFRIVYTSKYTEKNTVYDSKYAEKNTVYTAKYEEKNTVYAPKYTSKRDTC